MYQVGHLGHKATPRSPREGERRRGGRGVWFGKELFPVLVHQAEFIVQHRLVARHELPMPGGGGGGGGVQVLGFRQFTRQLLYVEHNVHVLTHLQTC